MDITEIREPNALLELEPEWRRLFNERDDLSPFLSPDWTLSWRDKFLPKAFGPWPCERVEHWWGSHLYTFTAGPTVIASLR